jgi:Na+/melibiose symporter-like transporter
VSFTTRADYRDALRVHRAWYATTALFLAALAPAWMLGLTLLSMTHAQGAVGWLILLALPFSIATAWTWMDAAHRVAGRRARLTSPSVRH